MNLLHRGILNAFLRIYPLKIYGKENIPEGKAVFVCNHFRAIDCAYVAKIEPKNIKFLAKKELFKKKALAGILKRFGAIPIDRKTPDMSTVLQVMKHLKADKKICIFAEGTRNKTDTNELQQLKNGFLVFALKTSSPIIPIMLLNRGKAFKKTKLVIGEPIYFSEYFGKKIDEVKQEELSNIVRNSMVNLQSFMPDKKDKK